MRSSSESPLKGCKNPRGFWRTPKRKRSPAFLALDRYSNVTRVRESRLHFESIFCFIFFFFLFSSVNYFRMTDRVFFFLWESKAPRERALKRYENSRHNGHEQRIERGEVVRAAEDRPRAAVGGRGRRQPRLQGLLPSCRTYASSPRGSRPLRPQWVNTFFFSLSSYWLYS